MENGSYLKAGSHQSTYDCMFHALPKRALCSKQSAIDSLKEGFALNDYAFGKISHSRFLNKSFFKKILSGGLRISCSSSHLRERRCINTKNWESSSIN